MRVLSVICYSGIFESRLYLTRSLVLVARLASIMWVSWVNRKRTRADNRSTFLRRSTRKNCARKLDCDVWKSEIRMPAKTCAACNASHSSVKLPYLSVHESRNASLIFRQTYLADRYVTIFDDRSRFSCNYRIREKELIGRERGNFGCLILAKVLGKIVKLSRKIDPR